MQHLKSRNSVIQLRCKAKDSYAYYTLIEKHISFHSDTPKKQKHWIMKLSSVQEQTIGSKNSGMEHKKYLTQRKFLYPKNEN